jgi:hypothetical protein
MLRYRQPIGVACLVGVAAFMWHSAASQFTAGFLDLVYFVPPSAVLALSATWMAHMFVPSRFTWQRGMVGAFVGGLFGTPLVAFLVAFSAAWDRASFQFVFNLGAWLALVGGLCVGAAGEFRRWVRAWRKSRRTMPDASHGNRPTARRLRPRYSRHMTVPR